MARRSAVESSSPPPPPGCMPAHSESRHLRRQLCGRKEWGRVLNTKFTCFYSHICYCCPVQDDFSDQQEEVEVISVQNVVI